MQSKIYVLTRNGRFYSWSHDREQLVGVVTANPDFTAKDADGSIPAAAILTYSLQEIVNV